MFRTRERRGLRKRCYTEKCPNPNRGKGTGLFYLQRRESTRLHVTYTYKPLAHLVILKGSKTTDVVREVSGARCESS